MSKRIAVKLAAVLLLLTGGCMWNKPGSGSLASIVIDEIPLSQIRSETMQVFAKEYYRATDVNDRKIVFEREGTQKDRLKYAGYEQALVMRVIVQFEDFGENSTLIRADAYAVRGDFGRTQKLMRIDRWSYQSMLDQVQAAFPISADAK